MDLLNEKIMEDRIATYRTREMILNDLIQGAFKIITESIDPAEIKEEAKNLADYRLQLVEVQSWLKKCSRKCSRSSQPSIFY